MDNSILQRLRTGLSTRLARNWPQRVALSRSDTPFVSFSFDDFPHSAACEGAEILARYSAKGTYFVSGARLGSRVEGLDHFTECDLETLTRDGHELGCHTFGHLRLSEASVREIENDLARNREFLARYTGAAAPTSFAYPFGDVSVRSKTLLARHFSICRGIDWGMNQKLIDFGQLKAVILTRSLSRARIARLLDSAMACNGWVIFFTHDVSAEPNEHGCRPGQLSGVLDDVADRGIPILPVADAAQRILASSGLLPQNHGAARSLEKARDSVGTLPV